MDTRNSRDGAAIEQVGWYNTIAKDDIYTNIDMKIMNMSNQNIFYLN